MSLSTPVCHLFCSKCKRESAKSLRHYDRDHARNYLEIIVLSPARGGDAAFLKCKRCGHTYISASRAARRALRRFNAQEKETTAAKSGCSVSADDEFNDVIEQAEKALALQPETSK